MLTFPYTTNEVVPLDVEADGVPLTNYQVKVVPAGDPAPTAAQITVNAETDGSITGVRVTGLTPGYYAAYPKIGTRIRGPIWFRLTDEL